MLIKHSDFVSGDFSFSDYKFVDYRKEWEKEKHFRFLWLHIVAFYEMSCVTLHLRDRLTGNDAVGTTYLDLAKIASSGGEIEGIIYFPFFCFFCGYRWADICFWFYLFILIIILKCPFFSGLEEHAGNAERPSYEGLSVHFF